jgi:hypothetical protein
MKKILSQLLVLVLLISACGKSVEKKPSRLLSRDRMISILVDIHLAESVYQTSHYTNNSLKQYTESDYYYSILHKYKTADTVFEQSLIYYSGKPKEFEKIYSRVLNRLNEMQQEVAEKKEQPVKPGNIRTE